MNKATAATLVLMFFFSASFFVLIVGYAEANPLIPPLVKVGSPQNFKIYESTDVPLNFTPIANTGITLTSFAYSLDGQEKVEINGSIVLSGLSWGSHSVAIYGNGSYIDNSASYIFTLGKIHFSVVYSTEWLVVATVFAVVIGFSLFMVFKTRKRLANVLRGKKTAVFWFGLGFLFVAAFFFFRTSIMWQAIICIHTKACQF